MITAPGKHVIFQFCDDITSGRFINTSHSGFLISSLDTMQSTAPRWGQVTHVGPEVTNVKVGDFILIDEGKWTNGFYVDDQRYWKTDAEQIVGTSDAPSEMY